MAYLLALDVDPSIVRPGWTPLIIVLLLAAAMVLLFLSMRRQFRKIKIGDEETAGAAEEATGDTTADPKSSKPASPNGSA